MKTVNIKGKEYIEVSERIKHFRANYPDHSLKTEVVELTDEFCVLKATICRPNGDVIATGIAREVNGDGYINKTSYVENCETSAWGRALGNLGIGIDTGIASADEVKTDDTPRSETVDHFIVYAQEVAGDRKVNAGKLVNMCKSIFKRVPRDDEDAKNIVKWFNQTDKLNSVLETA